MSCELPCWSTPGAPLSESSALQSQPPAGGSPPRSPSPSLWPASGQLRPAGSESSELDSPLLRVLLPVGEATGQEEEERWGKREEEDGRLLSRTTDAFRPCSVLCNSHNSSQVLKSWLWGSWCQDELVWWSSLLWPQGGFSESAGCAVESQQDPPCLSALSIPLSLIRSPTVRKQHYYFKKSSFLSQRLNKLLMIVHDAWLQNF